MGSDQQKATPKNRSRAGAIALRTLLGLVGAAAFGFGVVYLLTERRLAQKFDVTPAELGVDPKTASAERGKHIAVTRGCVDCHKENLAGGLFVDAGPVMRLVTTNLTRGKGGIGGSYSDRDWVRSVRHGVRPDGTGVRFMPCLDYNPLSDEDMAALIAYVRSVPPVDNEPERTSIGPLGRVLYLLGELPFLSAELIDHTAKPIKSSPKGDGAEHGKYLSATCIGCHGDHFSGGKIPGVPPEWPQAANLTPHDSGLGKWSKAQFVTLMRTGTRPDGRVLDPQYMPWKQFKNFSDEELNALWAHLQTLPAKPAGGR